MKSRKVKAAARSKAYMKKLKGSIPLDVEENSFDEHEGEDSVEEDDNTQFQEDSSSEEEVLPITDDENDSSEEEEEGENEDEDLPDLNNWGKKKSIYYNADFVDKDRGKTYREEDLELENAEREAAGLQQETAMQLDRFESSAYLEDYDRALELISKKLPLKSEGELQDADNLEIEKLKHESRKYPKLSEYKENFKEKFSEVNEKLAPLLELSERVELDEKLVYFIKLKYHILLHYLLNINFYFYLKCSEDVPENHPIYKKIEQFKNLDEQMNSHKSYLKEIESISLMLKENKDISVFKEKVSKPDSLHKRSEDRNSARKSSPGKNKSLISKLFSNVKEASEKNLVPGTEEMEGDFDAENPTKETGDEKRMITYQIAKNKGLIAKRKKEQRNPRVHNRMKYRKAKIRRKGQVRGVVKEMKRYAGEPTGISAHVVRSTKIK
nr:something about silencing protein 10-like isoform X2 [Parasteatoda tepidariorum]